MSMRMETSKTDSKKTGRKVINMVSAEGFLFADAMMQKKNRRKNMLRKIKNGIYCITSYTGNRHFIECDSEDELAAHVAEGECKGYTVTSVTKICTDGSRPRVAVKSNPYYKKTIKEFIEKF